MMSRRLTHLIVALSFIVTTASPPSLSAAIAYRTDPLVTLTDAQPAAQPANPIMLPPMHIVWDAPTRHLAAPPARTVQTPPIIEVRICNTDSGCTGPVTTTLATDSPLTLYAAAYGSDPDPFEGNQPVTWTVSSGATVSPGTGITTTLNGNTPGTVAVTATLITTPSIQTAATFTVTLGALHHLTVRDAAGGGGAPVGDATRTSGTAWNLYAGGYDIDNNFIADQVVTWTLTGGIGSVDPDLGSSTVFTAGIVGTGAISAKSQANPTIIDTTGVITVVHGTLDHFNVNLPTTGTAGVGFTSTVTAKDASNNTVLSFGSGVTLSTSNGGTISPLAVTPAAGVWTGAITLTTAGTGRQVNAQSGAPSGSGTIDIAPGPISTLILSPNNASVTAGNAIAYTAIASDTFGNAIGDVTGSTTFAIQPGSGGAFVANSVTPIIRGNWIVTGTNGAGLDTTALTVNPGAPMTVTLQANPTSLVVGNSSMLTATVVDLYGNAVADGTNVVFSSTIGLAQSPATTSNGVATSSISSTLAGAALITATSGAAQRTTTVTFTPGPFAKLAIETAPDGSGTPITNVTMSLYNTLTAYAVGYDMYDNVIGPQTSTWGASGIASGQIAPLTGTATTFTPAAVLSGTGTLTATAGAISDTTGLITVQAPVLQIGKIASPDPVTPGALLRYTLVYTNSGNTATQSARITETYPVSTSFLLAIPAPTSGNNVWSIGSLAPGESGTIDAYVQVAGQLPVSAVLTNSVRFGGLKIDTAIYTTTTQVDATPDVQISVNDSADPVRVGDLLVYTIQYVNNGTGLATGVRITETYPSQVTFVSANPAPSIGNNVWLTSSLGSTSKIINVTVRVNSPLADTTVLDNTVTIDTNETAPFSDQEVTLVRSPIVSLTKSANPASPQANGSLVYTLRYTNTGSTYASNVVITDAVPLNTAYQSCAPVGCSQLGGLVTWNISQVPSLASGLLTMTVLVNNNLDKGTILTNTARISTTENVSAFVRLTNTIVSTPVLSLSKSDGVASAAAGDLLTYTLSYANTGNAPAKNVVITDRIPSNVAFQSCTNSCVAMGSGVYSFTLGSVNASTNGSVKLTVKVDPSLPAGLRAITNTANILTSSVDDNPANNFSTDVDTISTVPALALGVSFDSNTPYPTKVLTYTLRYTNTSAMDTTGVVISVTKSPYVNYIGYDWTFVGGFDYTYNIGDLGAGASGVVIYVVSLPYPYTAEMNAFANTFSIRDNGPGGLPIVGATRSTLLGVPDLVIDSVTLSPSTIAAEQKFTATVTIRNKGLGRACNPKSPACGAFSLDVFIDPPSPPSSFPFSGSYGDTFAYIAPLNPGLTTTVKIPNLSFTAQQEFILYFKLDNWDCNDGSNPCVPIGAQHGLVPESDEYNNVLGPIDVSSHFVYIPFLLKNR